jgi:hypothetical protein
LNLANLCSQTGESSYVCWWAHPFYCCTGSCSVKMSQAERALLMQVNCKPQCSWSDSEWAERKSSVAFEVVAIAFECFYVSRCRCFCRRQIAFTADAFLILDPRYKKREIGGRKLGWRCSVSKQTHCCFQKVFLSARTMMQSLLFPRPPRASSVSGEQKKLKLKGLAFKFQRAVFLAATASAAAAEF